VLNAMASLAPNLHEDIVGVWSEVIPKMQVKLEGETAGIHHIAYLIMTSLLCLLLCSVMNSAYVL